MNDLHIVQMQILRELTFHPNSKFTQLNLSDLTSDHFSYHIKSLIKLGLVLKLDNKYSLTQKGKQYTLKMDTEKMVTEKQPKISVLIRPIYKKGKETFYAIQQRLKEPYYGYYGFMTGKVKWGEKIIEAAARELDEEMGLKGEIKPAYVLHEMVYDKQGNMLEDKYFHCVNVEILEDTLKLEEEGCSNSWMTREQFIKIEPKYHNELEILEWFEKKETGFVEGVYFIEKF